MTQQYGKSLFLSTLLLFAVSGCGSTPKAPDSAAAPVSEASDLAQPAAAAPQPDAQAQPVAAAQPQPTSVPLQQMMLNVISASNSFTYQYSGWINTPTYGVGGSGTIDLLPPESVVVNNRSLIKQETRSPGSVLFNGAPRDVTSSSTSYHDPATGATLFDESKGRYVVYDPYTFPVDAKVGDSGRLTRAVVYRDRSMQDRIGYLEVSYSVEGGSDGPPQVTLTTESFANDGTSFNTASITFRSNAAGRMEPLKARSIGHAVRGRKPYELFSIYLPAENSSAATQTATSDVLVTPGANSNAAPATNSDGLTLP